MNTGLQLSQLDTVWLIQEVKARPDLYSREAPKYNDPSFKRNLWEDIASKLFANVWNTYNAEEKAKKAELVHRRWKHLRAGFARELRCQKDPQKWIYGVAYKRRKYLYYNELSFLKDDLDKTNGYDESALGIDLPKSNEDNTTVTIDTDIEECPIPEALRLPVTDQPPSRTPITNPEHSSRIDADSTNYALSLVPMLNMLPISKRINAQISIFTILKQYLQDEDSGSSVTNGDRGITNGDSRIMNSDNCIRTGKKRITNDGNRIKNDDRRTANSERSNTNDENRIMNTDSHLTNGDNRVTNGYNSKMTGDRRTSNNDSNITSSDGNGGVVREFSVIPIVVKSEDETNDEDGDD